VYRFLNDLPAAEGRYRRRLEFKERQGDTSGQAWFLRALGPLLASQGRRTEAVEVFTREVKTLSHLKVDASQAQEELDAARQHRMVDRKKLGSGWF
jgi:hypothetical protein